MKKTMRVVTPPVCPTYHARGQLDMFFHTIHVTHKSCLIRALKVMRGGFDVPLVPNLRKLNVRELQAVLLQVGEEAGFNWKW